MFKKLLTTTLVFCVIALVAISQSAYAQPATLWTQTFGTAGRDSGYSVRQTSDGGYIIAGIYDYHSTHLGGVYLTEIFYISHFQYLYRARCSATF